MRTMQTNVLTPSLIALGAFLGLFSAAPATASDHGAGTCEDVYGPFTAVMLPPDQCSSPVGFCTHGQLSGDIDGTYDFVMTSSEPAPTEEHPTREVFTGISTITTDAGVMYGEDFGEIWFDGDTGFITFIGVVDGEQCYQNVYGDLEAQGEIDLATGQSIGSYSGTICMAKQCFVRDDTAN